MLERHVRFRVNGNGGDAHGVVVDDVVRHQGGETPLAEVVLLPPCEPTKLIYVGLNYALHVEEIGLGGMQEEPLLFLKPPSALLAPGGEIVAPAVTERLEYEGELALVIGRRVAGCSVDEAPEAIAGYTVANDVTARDFQRADTQWTKAKCYDTFAPLGPWLVTGVDPSDLRITTTVNGVVRQEGTTRDLIVGPAELVAYASSIMTLEPGDVISTGTPAGVGRIDVGDVVEVSIEQVGTLRNTVVGPEGRGA